MRTSEFQAGDLLVVDDLEGMTDQWRGLLLRDAALIDTYRRDRPRMTVLFLKRTKNTSYNVNVTTGNQELDAIEITFETCKELSRTSLWIEQWAMFDVHGMNSANAFLGIPCLARVFRDGQEIHRCLTS